VDTVDASEFFKPWERVIASFDDIANPLTTLFEKWVKDDRRLFAWRGVVDASWPLHSSLYRRALWTSTSTRPPDEAALFELEGRVLASVHRWGLHDGDRGRLSILAQLATLQHFGAPTRLIDVTMNAYRGCTANHRPIFMLSRIFGCARRARRELLNEFLLSLRIATASRLN
jgi:hypothetical protein